MYLRIGKVLEVNVDDEFVLIGIIIIGFFALFGMMIVYVPKGP